MPHGSMHMYQIVLDYFVILPSLYEWRQCLFLKYFHSIAMEAKLLLLNFQADAQVCGTAPIYHRNGQVSILPQIWGYKYLLYKYFSKLRLRAWCFAHQQRNTLTPEFHETSSFNDVAVK